MCVQKRKDHEFTSEELFERSIFPVRIYEMWGSWCASVSKHAVDVLHAAVTLGREHPFHVCVCVYMCVPCTDKPRLADACITVCICELKLCGALFYEHVCSLMRVFLFALLYQVARAD